METRHSECRTGETKITFSYTTVKMSSRDLESFGLGNTGGLTSPVTVKSSGRKISPAFAQNVRHEYRLQTGFFGFFGFFSQDMFLKKKKNKARSCTVWIYYSPNRNVQFVIRQHLKWQKNLVFLVSS